MNTRTSIVVSIIFLFFSYSLSAQLRLNENNQLFLNHDGNPIGTSSFTLSSENSGYTGMYINSAGDANRWPFYGYAVNGSPVAWQFYDSNTNQLATNVSFQNKMLVGVDSTTFLTDVVGKGDLRAEGDFSVGTIDYPLLRVNAQEGILFNATEPFNTFTTFTLNTLPDGLFQGMYINGKVGQRPYYGYGIDGSTKAWTSFNDDVDALNFYVEGVNIGPTLSLYDNKAVINRPLIINGTTLQKPDDILSLYSESSSGFINLDVEGTSGASVAGYTFSLDGNDKGGLFYFDSTDEITIGGANDPIIKAHGEIVEINSVITLSDVQGSIIQTQPGSIFYAFGNFYGKLFDGSVAQLDNNVSAKQLSELEKEVDGLRAQNEMLLNELKNLKNKFALIDQQLQKLME